MKMKISWKLFKSEIKSKSASKKRSNLCYFLKYFCCVDLNCCQRSYGQSLEEKFQEGNKIQSIINNHKVNFNKLFLPAKWKLSRYEKNPSHAGAWNPLFLKHSFKIFPSTEETIDTLFPRGAWSSMADKFDWKFCGNRIECPSLDATRYARGLVSWPVMRHRTFGHAILYREALAEDSKAIYVAKRFLVVGAEPVGSDRYNWFFPPWKTIAMVVNKTPRYFLIFYSISTNANGQGSPSDFLAFPREGQCWISFQTRAWFMALNRALISFRYLTEIRPQRLSAIFLYLWCI